MSEEVKQSDIEDFENLEVKCEEESSLSEEELQELRDNEAVALLNSFIKDQPYREKAKRYIELVDKSLGIKALEFPDNYDRNSVIERAIHYMRWEPHYLFDCPLHELHEYEMAIAAYVTFVKAKENQWRIMCKNAQRDLKRALKLAASYAPGKTVGEREAYAVNKYPTLKEIEKELDVYMLYMEKCQGIADAITQMDNSLKKTLETRREELRNASKHTTEWD
ncbi:MAG: hypothetical protein ACP6IQ_02195 [Candidatus Njordarchaeia archaeon]